MLTLPIDDRVLAQAGRFKVLAECQQVLLRNDGGCIGLHVVRENGHDAMYLRAVQHGDCLLIVFDLRDVCPQLAEINQHHEYDVPGLIMYTMRAVFETKGEALSVMMSRPLDVLTMEGATHVEALAA